MAEATTRSLRQVVKQAVPKHIICILARSRNYIRRLNTWCQALLVVRGNTSKDTAVLWRSVIRAPLSMLRDLDKWREPILLENADVVVEGLGTFAIRGNSDDFGHVLPKNFAAIFSVIQTHVKSGDTLIDAGSNIGVVTVWMAHCTGSTGRVIAIEMMPNTADQLRKNIAHNNLYQVELVQMALSDRGGETVIANVEPGVYGQASIVPGTNASQTVQKVKVETTTLDDITADLGEVALIKMDLEGAEPNALRGALNTLSRTRAVIFESWTGRNDEASRILAENGFAISPIDGRNFLAIRGKKTSFIT